MAESATQFGYSIKSSKGSLQDMELHNSRPSKEGSDIALEDADRGKKSSPNPWMDSAAFPDGGAKAWLTVAGASSCLFVSFGWVNCVGVFQEYYQRNQLKQYTASDIAWIPALQSRCCSP